MTLRKLNRLRVALSPLFISFHPFLSGYSSVPHHRLIGGQTLEVTMNEISVGFIGLGIMGQPMARNLLRAGFRLRVATRRPGKAEEFARANSTPGLSPEQGDQGQQSLVEAAATPAARSASRRCAR